MGQAAGKLVLQMQKDVENCANGDDGELESKYRSAVEAVGRAPLLIELFRRFEDSTLTGLLLCLSFAWKDLSFADWKRVLYGISDDTSAIYQFVPFATEFLAIDIASVIREDPAVNVTARTFTARQFPKGGPAPGSDWVRRALHDRGIDAHQLWRRLAGEGAPMRSEARGIM